jgi:hypothetical protein
MDFGLGLAAGLSSIAHLWLYGNKMKAGPIVGTIGQGIWVVYILHGGHHGLWPCVLAHTVIHTRNWIKWRR